MWRQIEFAKWGKNMYFVLWTEREKKKVSGVLESSCTSS